MKDTALLLLLLLLLLLFWGNRKVYCPEGSQANPSFPAGSYRLKRRKRVGKLM
jgi:hypothetical protein